MKTIPIRPVAAPAADSPLQRTVRQIAQAHAQQPGALLPLLHAVQDALGHVPPTTVQVIADELNLSRAEVHGVISYYHHFRSEPAGRVLLQVCQAEACQARGAAQLADDAERIAGCSMHGTSADGSVTLEPVYCLGLCTSGPSVMINGQPQAQVTAQRLQALVSRALAEAPRDAAARSADISARAGAAVRVFLPCDSGARAAGADEVAQALQAEAARRGTALELVRNGSRGLFWLEPLLEVQTPAGRVGFGPVTVDDVGPLLDAGALDPLRAGRVEHPLALGLVDALPYLKRQQRLTFARMGITDPLSLADYEAHGGWAGLRAALAMGGDGIVAQVLDSGLRGRGGAAFPAGIKWKTVRAAAGAQKYVVCNADEGDSGTFSDRMTMEGDPYLLIEGMAIAGIAVGATRGYIYVRSEYPDAIAVLNQAITRATDAGWLGASVAGSGHAFTLEVRKAAGSYVCGEETAMLESIEGKRGIVRAKPPLPAIAGLFGCPTVINNVITFASVPVILARGAAFYRDYGMGRSSGTLPFQLAGNVKHGGLVELAFGVTLRELVFGFGGGTASGRPVKAIQVGGPLGAYVPESKWDLPLDYETYTAMGATVGHGGIVVHDDRANLAKLARYAMDFCAIESCGKCTPCRIGSTRGVEVIDRIVKAPDAAAREQQVELLRDLCDTMVHGSLCAMGGMTPYPVLSALDHYPQDFGLPAAALSKTTEEA